MVGENSRAVNLRTISARRLALLPALLGLVVSPLFVSVYLGNPIEAQKYLVLLCVFSGWFIYLPWRILREKKALGPWSSLDAWVGAVACTTVLSVILSPERQISFLSVILPLAMLSFYFLMSEILASVPARDRIVGGLLISAGIVAVIGLLQYVGIELLPYTHERSNVKQVILSTMGHPNFVASYIGPVIFLAPIVFLVTPAAKGWRFFRIASVVIVFLLMVCVLLTGARGMWVGLFSSALLLAAFYFFSGGRLPLAMGSVRISWKIPTALAAGFVLLIALLVIPNPLVKSRFSLTQRLVSGKEVQSRLFYWVVAEEMIARKPIFGIGYRRFSTSFWNEVVEMEKKPENAFFKDYMVRVRGKMPGEAHNEFIEITAEQGFVGLAAFLGMLLWFGVSAGTLVASGAVDRARRVRLVYLMSAIFVTLMDSMFGFPLQLPASGLLFWAMLAMLRSEILAAREQAREVS